MSVGIAGGGGVSGFKPGAAGPAGPTGDTGPTGPTGPSGENAVAAREGGVEVVAELTALNFDATDFAVTDETGGVAGISLGSAPSFTDFTNAGHDHTDADDGGQLTVAALSDITASAAELNTLDGITASTAELNILDGVTSTAAELNALDGIGSITGVLRSDAGTLSADTDVTDLVTAASTEAAGKVELATTAETETGADTTRAVTPDGLHDMTTLAGAAWFLDEDNMASDSATKTASQQSIKAYADTKQPLDADLTTLSTAFTTASASGAASLAFHEDTDNGTNRVLLQGPASTADVTVTLPASTGTLYVSGGTDVALADGGTGASLADPGADRIMFWDDSAGAVDWLTPDSGDFTITTTTIALASAPTFSDFTNAQHDHADADDGGQLTDAALSSAVGIAKGGTGQTSQTAAFDALAPTTTQGDIIYYNGSDNVRLGPGASGQRLTTGGAGANPSWAAETRNVNIVVGDGTNVIPTGVYTDFDLPVAGTFIRWRIMATKFTSGSTGSITFDLWADTYANFPPTVADSISTSKPTLTTAASAEDSTITDWTPEAFAAGQTFRLNVDSASLVTLCTLSLWYTVP